MSEDNHPILFMQLVMQNQQIAMMAMGKIKNPVTDKIDRNLEYAKVSIDTLDMLQARTKGNLTEYEEKFLSEALKDLKLNYVDEVEKDKTGSTSEEPKDEKDTTDETPPEENSAK
ncbi:MAG: DUF1844 domain-containing protein [Ignavibacteria bacterium]|nr:DUF1844 domain-containing protein [Ignavibacteria bacterium]